MVAWSQCLRNMKADHVVPITLSPSHRQIMPDGCDRSVSEVKELIKEVPARTIAGARSWRHPCIGATSASLLVECWNGETVATEFCLARLCDGL